MVEVHQVLVQEQSPFLPVPSKVCLEQKLSGRVAVVVVVLHRD